MLLNWWPVQDFSINLNAQHVIGMTPTYVRLLDTLE